MTRRRPAHHLRPDVAGESGRPRAAVRLLAALLSLLVLAFSAEIGLRVYQRLARGVPFFTLLPNHFARDQFPFSPFLVFGPHVGDSLPGKRFPGLARFNAQGFRAAEESRISSNGRYRIIALGGSTTEDRWNSLGIHWPAVAECRLRQRGFETIEVWNGGMSAYATPHTLIRLALDVVEYRPDLLLVMHNVNDLTTAYVAAATGRPLDAHYLVKFGTDAYTGEVEEDDVILSRLAWSIRARLRPKRAPAMSDVIDYDLARIRSLFARNLRSIAAVARSHGITPVLMTMPFDAGFVERGGAVDDVTVVGVLAPRDSAAFRRDVSAMNEVVRAVAAEEAVPVIDMAALVPPGSGYFIDAVHFTAAGSLLFGSTLADALMPLLPADRDWSAAGEPGSCHWLPEAERIVGDSARWK